MRRGIPAKRRKNQWISIIIISLILSFIMVLGFRLLTSRLANHVSAEKHNQILSKKSPAQPLLQSSKSEGESQPSFSSQFFQKDQQSLTVGQIIVGNVSIMNRNGNIITIIPAPVINGAWLALPARACIGGNKWFFKAGNDEAIGIEGGLWGRGDSIGFWRLSGEKKYQGPAFDTWQQDKPVVLFSIETGSLSDPMILPSSGTRGAFTYCPLPTPLEPGVFLQNGKVVGWSFGELLDGAFMWNRGPNPDLLYENYVEDFYNETFAGGREEYFSLALAMGDDSSSPQMQLQMFTEGFWFSPKLSPEDTPRYLRPETVYPYITKLVGYMMSRKSYSSIATLAEEPLLVEVGSIEILTHVIRAIRESYGTEGALNFTEGPGTDIEQTIDGDKTALDELHLELYLGWIKMLIDNRDIVKGWQVYNKARNHFSEAPELHMLAVELALASEDWAEAERLLYQKKYPPALRETKMLLGKRVSTMKGRENKLIVRFQSGSREIPVTATVNDKFDNDFLIDTGASFVTIPYSTVEALGLEGEISPHQQEVNTAGGTITANFVILSSIELQGWAVSSVKALIVDLPNRPGLGLLGLNYLNRFRLDLQADEGILTLEPQ
jgi:clan AA aspartic protease (TIGR02281 family)